MIVALEATTSFHQRLGLKRSGWARQLPVRIAAVALTACEFMWKSGSGFRMRSRPHSSRTWPPSAPYQAPAFR